MPFPCGGPGAFSRGIAGARRPCGSVRGARATGGPNASENWPEGHAKAAIVGSGGLEMRAELRIGVSLLAREVGYPDHNHRPEEVFLVLTPGRFRHGSSAWFEPGMGGTLFNEPDI